VTLGSFVLAAPHNVEEVGSILLEALPNGTYPTVNVLLNEISGTFVNVPLTAADPAQLPASQSVWMKRHDLSGAQTPLARTLIRHMQLNLSFVAEDQATEILGIAID